MEAPAGQGDVHVLMQIDGTWRNVITAAQAATILNLDEGYVRQLCDQGALIATKYNGRWWVHEQMYENTYVDIVPS